MTSKWLKRSRILLPCGRNWWRMLILTDQLHCSTVHTWDVLNVNANRTKSLSMGTKKCSNHEFLLEQVNNCQRVKKLTQKLSRGHMIRKDMLENALRDIANKQTKRQSSYMKSPCLDDHHFKKGGTWVSWRIVKSMVTDCLKMLVLGTKWKTWHSLVSEQTCSIGHQMDRSTWPTFSSFDITSSSHKWLPTIWSCGKHGSALSIEFIPRLRFCWRPWGLKKKINLGENFMYFRKSHIRSHQLDVQERNVSISQFYRIRNYFVGCWFKNGRATCSWLVGRGDRSVTFIEEYWITNPWSSRKLLAKSQIQTQTKGKRRCWSIVTCGPRHRKRKFFSRLVSDEITKQWSKWSSRAEVQRWDTCPEPKELRLIGDLTASIWTPKSKSNTLTPKTNSRTCWPKAVLRVMNGTIFFDCWTSWISRCFLAAIFFQTESRVSCPRELRKARQKKVRQWRNRGRWVWCQGTSWVQRKPFRKIGVLRTARGNKSWIRVLFRGAPGNWCEATTKTQQHILTSGDKMTLDLRAPGKWCEVMTVK